jgi:multidrug efflux pump subunit AcrB
VGHDGHPVSFLGALLLMPSMDVSVNMVSLFAFIVTLGMVVDDAIVVGENIYNLRQKGVDFVEAAIKGAREVASPVTFSIATTIAAFTPMFFVPGFTGKLYRVIPVIVVTVLTISLFESLFILPAHLANSKGRTERGVIAAIDRVQERFSNAFERWVARWYSPVLAATTRQRYLTLAVGLAMLATAAGYVAGGRIGFTFLPKIEGDVVFAQVKMPFGTSVEDTKAAQEKMLASAQRVMQEFGGEERYSRGMFAQVGAHSASGGPRGGAVQGSGSHLAEVQLILVPADQRDFIASDFVKRWREDIGAIAGADTIQFSYSTGASAGAPIDLEISHTSMEALERAAADLTDKMRAFAGVKDLENGFSEGRPSST